jgi:hypothetical protein
MAEDRSAISGVGHHGPSTSETVAGMADLGRWRDSSACAVWGGYSFGHGTVVISGRLCPARGPLNLAVVSFDLGQRQGAKFHSQVVCFFIPHGGQWRMDIAARRLTGGAGGAGFGSSAFSPGQQFRQNGPVAGYPGASGYAPGRLIAFKRSRVWLPWRFQLCARSQIQASLSGALSV